MDTDPPQLPQPGQEDEESSQGSELFRAALRVLIAVAAFAGLLVADGVLFWVFLVILTAAIISVLPFASRSRRRARRGRYSQPAVPPPPTGSGHPPLSGGDRRVLLDIAGPNKIEVIKVVREIDEISLAEAKALVDSAPVVVAVGLSDHEAHQVQALLHAAGANARVDGPAA